MQSSEINDAMLIALRRVIRAVDQHSRRLAHSHGLTGPQAVVMQETLRAGAITPGELARRISLSQATVTDIVKRLEQRGLLARQRSTNDKRKVVLEVTDKGRELLQAAPPLLQDTFVQRFSRLAEWEQLLLLSSLQRIAELMDAQGLDAAPLLAIADPALPEVAVPSSG